ncbi:MAG TPA: hypothetical protein VGS08_02170 [Candidatus Saccharimonadales bacterium]|nr:hypothetical protein [Candidatus Saccharimonadales bacterium]
MENTSEKSNDSPTNNELPPDITENKAIDEAVDQISSEEADTALAAQDAQQAADNEPPHGLGHWLGNCLSACFGTRKGRWRSSVVAVLLIVGAGCIPTIRYWMLNECGVRGSLSVTAVDSSTQLPLADVMLIAGHVHAVTNANGRASLQWLKLGPQIISLQRPGFAVLRVHVVLGWGSNPLGSLSLKDVGQQYHLVVRDYVSGTALTSATATADGMQTAADKNGTITLTINNPGLQPVAVTVSAGGYSPQSVSLSGAASAVTVQLLPAEHEVFVAQQNGRYNLYACDISGQNRQLLLSGTPTETGNIDLSVSPDGSQAVLSSTRDATYSSDGSLLTTLTLVNVNTMSTVTLDHALSIRLIGWLGTDLIYQEDTSAGPISNYNIISYNYVTNSRNQLASASQFSDVLTAGGDVYYAVPAAATTTADGLYVMSPDGSHRQTILAGDAQTVLRQSYTTLLVQTTSAWYSVNIGGSSATAISTPPGTNSNRLYVDSPDGSHSVWIDGEGSSSQLHSYNADLGQDSALSVDNASYPVRWLNNADIVYRVTTANGSADYAVSLSGGTPKEITTISNTGGLGSL